MMTGVQKYTSVSGGAGESRTPPPPRTGAVSVWACLDMLGNLRTTGLLDFSLHSTHLSPRNFKELDLSTKGQQEMGPSWVGFAIFPRGIQTCQQIHIGF